MTILTTSDIDIICIEILDKIKREYPFYYPHVYFMYHYGVRIGETFGNHIESDFHSGKIIIYPQKKNQTRIHNPIDSETLYNLELLQKYSVNLWLNKRNLQRILEKVHPIRSLKCGRKKINAHIFRHNWVKKQITVGKQIVNINSMLGYTWQNVATSYAISQLYY